MGFRAATDAYGMDGHSDGAAGSASRLEADSLLSVREHVCLQQAVNQLRHQMFPRHPPAR